jgi:hypothetical protein
VKAAEEMIGVVGIDDIEEEFWSSGSMYRRPNQTKLFTRVLIARG